MTPNRSHLLLASIAFSAILAGVLALRYVPTFPRRSPPPRTMVAPHPSAPETPAWMESAGGAFLQELRRHQSSEIAEPPPQEAAAEPETVPTEPLPTIEALFPLPPVRPSEVAVGQNGATAPLPPRRPGDVAALPPSEAPSSPAAAPPPVAAAPEPALKPAPDDAFLKESEPRLQMGSAVFVRIFKQEGQLELWLKHNGRFALYRTYPICKWSGRLGPKLKEADYQSPEGFYSVSARQLNPNSNYHRAFNVGYPNAFDRQNGRTGGLVMVHGACKSVGCFAMTDRGIEEIYGFVAAAISAGQHEVPVHIFPFRMTESAIAKETGGGWLAFVSGGGSFSQWNAFWRNLKEGYDMFEQTGEPPIAYACGDHYAFSSTDPSCRRIAGW
jgi:murein L,D-transpeptidase YafK